MCLGDFNDLLSQAEKRGSSRHPFHFIQGFHDTIENCGLKEIHMVGYPYTLDKSPSTLHWVEHKLDRAMGNLNWFRIFPNACVLNEDTTQSNHSTIVFVQIDRHKELKALFFCHKIHKTRQMSESHSGYREG